ncbi:MAG: LD-carboxypeptidase, partial [Ignavibacteria bacterium]|nr:LD-carboxypeptidase [Ignavibacteria bacterium]
YSDITSLQLAIFSRCGLVSFSGPMVAVEMYNGMDPFTEENFWRMITSNKVFGKMKNPAGEKICTLVKGKAKGRIIGGNLSMIASILGTPYLPKFDRTILITEDIDEKPYRIDRFFAQMKYLKIFDKISGLVLGNFTDCEETDQSKKSLTLNEVVYDYFSKMKKPVIYNFIYGHVKVKSTIPIGINAKLDANKGELEVLENCVR